MVRLRRSALRWSAGRCRRATLFPWLIMNHLPPASTPKDADSTPAMGRIGAMRRQFTGRGLGPERKKMDKGWGRGDVADGSNRRVERGRARFGKSGFQGSKSIGRSTARARGASRGFTPAPRSDARPIGSSLSHLKKRGEPQNPETLKKSHRKGAVKAGAARGRRLGRAKRRRDRFRTPHRSA